MADNNLNNNTKGNDKHIKNNEKKSLADLPAEVLIHIGLALPCREFGRFLQTNKAIRSCLDSHYVWHLRFTTRFGQTILEDKLNPSLPNNSDSTKLSLPLTPSSPRFPSPNSQTFHSSSSNSSNNNSANTSPILQQQLQFDNHLDPVSAASSPLPSAASSPRLTPSAAPHTPPSDSSSDDGSDSDGTGNGGEGSSSSCAKRPPKGKARRIDLRRTNMASKEMLIDMYKQLCK